MKHLVKTYRQLRARRWHATAGLREKVMSLEEAASLVNDGDHVAHRRLHLSRTPLAMIWALIRAQQAGPHRLALDHLDGGRPAASPRASSKHIITSWFTQGIVWGVSKVMRHYTENKLAALRGMEPHVDGPALSRRRHGHSVHPLALDDRLGCGQRARRTR